MTVAGDEQCSLLMLQCELTVLSQPRVPHCMKEGKIPVLIWLSTPYLHCTCTLKGWKNLAENKEKKDAALKMKEAADCCLVKQEKDLEPAEETKPSSVHHYLLWVWWNNNSGAKLNNLDCLCLFPLQSRETFFLQEEAPLGPVLGSVPEDVRPLCYCGTRIPQGPSAAEFQNTKTWQYFHCREVQDTKGSA